jgi:uncharacterized protein YndB with AHSA1/START domain
LAPYGVEVYAMEPGTVATAMSNFSVTSSEGRRWIPWFKGIFDTGLDSPMDRVAERAVDLAAGTSSALSGRYIPLTENLASLSANAPLIRRDALYSLRISRLPESVRSSQSVALRAARASAEGASQSVVRLRRRLAATAEQAFRLWRDGDTVASWFIPSGEEAWIERPTMVPHAGGNFSLRMSIGGERYHLHAVVIAAAPGASLDLDWSWESSSPILGSAAGTTVKIEFVPARSGVDVVITHEGLPNEAVRDAYIRGWRRCLEGMHRVIECATNPEGMR